MASDSRDPGSDLWLHRPDMWSGLVLAVALAGRSFRPSLMPRATPHQAIVAGASGAIGFGIGNVTYGAVARTGRTPVDLGLLAAAGGAGFAVSRLVPERDDEPEWRPIARAAGSALAAGAAAATLGVGVRGARPEHRHLAGATLTAVSGLTGTRAVLDGVRKQRLAHTDYDPPPPKALPAVGQSLAIAAGLTTVVTTFRHTSAVVGRILERRLGVPETASRWLGRGISVGAWYVSGKALADLFVNGLRTYDRVVDAGFDRAPTHPLRTAGPGSPVAFARLGREGRRFVLNVPSAEDISMVMGRPAVADPIRVFAGYAAARTDEQRVALAVDELRRTGAFDRRHLVVGCAAGNGYVNTLALEVLDYVTLGDAASVSVQYGRLPSFLTLQRVTRGGRIQRLLLEAIRDELADRPPDQRPRLLLYGESLGAWAGQDTFMHRGLDGLDELEVERALWVGTPYYSAWRREVLVDASVPVPAGSVIEVDRPDPLLALDDEARAALRVVVLGHGNDPVRYISAGLLVRRPPWLRSGPRPWGVPPDMQFLPGITAIQVIVDAVNATRPVPGVFRATGHEYTADLPEAVVAAYALTKPDADVWDGLVEHLQRVDAERVRANRLPRPEPGEPAGPATGAASASGSHRGRSRRPRPLRRLRRTRR